MPATLFGSVLCEQHPIIPFWPRPLQACRALLKLSPQSPEALTALSPLLLSCAACPPVSPDDTSSPSELCALASDIIRCGGDSALPSQPAGALLRLLCCETVITQLPPSDATHAVRNRLVTAGRDTHFALPDAVAEALAAKLQAHNPGLTPFSACCFVDRIHSGSNGGAVCRAARSLLQAEGSSGLSSYSSRQLFGILGSIVRSGIVETLDDVPSPVADGAEAATGKPREGMDTPLADLALRVYRELARAAKEGAMQLELERDCSDIAAMLRTAAALEERLQGLQVQRSELLDSLHTILESVEVSHVYVDDEYRVLPLPLDNTDVWDIMEVAFRLGERAAVDLSLLFRQRRRSEWSGI